MERLWRTVAGLLFNLQFYWKLVHSNVKLKAHKRGSASWKPTARPTGSLVGLCCPCGDRTVLWWSVEGTGWVSYDPWFLFPLTGSGCCSGPPAAPLPASASPPGPSAGWAARPWSARSAGSPAAARPTAGGTGRWRPSSLSGPGCSSDLWRPLSVCTADGGDCPEIADERERHSIINQSFQQLLSGIKFSNLWCRHWKMSAEIFRIGIYVNSSLWKLYDHFPTSCTVSLCQQRAG